jgi:hypothetical protein
MDPTSVIAFLIIGAVAGWLAGLLMRGRGFGLLCLGRVAAGRPRSSCICSTLRPIRAERRTPFAD